MYSACDREALAVVEDVSCVWRVYLLGCIRFSVVTNHATLTHLSKKPSDKLTDRQVQWIVRLVPFAHCMNILYCKVSVKEADAVSRCLDFFHPDDVHLRMLVEMFALWWD